MTARRRIGPLFWWVLTAANTVLCLFLLFLSLADGNYGRALINLVAGLVSAALTPSFFSEWKESAR